MATTEAECLAALREAAERLGASPTKAAYEELGLTPAASTVLRVCGGWNEAKERACLNTTTQAEAGGRPVGSKPPTVKGPDGCRWEELTPQQRWYYKNRRQRIDCKETRRKQLRSWLTEYKREHCQCDLCGESRVPCLDFHHPGEKHAGVASMVNDGYSKEQVRAEMERCRVLCATCHRRKHYREGVDGAGGAESPRQWLTRQKRESNGCTDCEESDPACLDYHHTGAKDTRVAEMVSRGYARADIEAEIERCELPCANCHRMEHHG